MNRTSTLLKSIAAGIALTIGLGNNSQAATITVSSTSGPAYSATITVTPTAIVPLTGTCPYGYNYTISYDYSISYSTTPPRNLDNLQFTFKCGSTSIGPNSVSSAAGSYTGNSSSSQYTSLTNCATATLASNSCVSSLEITVSGAGISSQTFTVLNPLPIGLVSFNSQAQNTGVVLTWVSSVATPETYYIERSKDAKSWSTIGKATATQSANSTFQYTDNAPLNGNNYYRLKMQNTDGSSEFSHTISQKINRTGLEEISVYPNPTKSNTIYFTGIKDAADWNLSLRNTLGQELVNATLVGNQIELPNIPNGLYMLQMTNSLTKESKMLKLMKD
ncbi:MAG: T9SS type A sorting domain-containing protein [Bacteroidetes bacterium]|nr:T9SS type A sorting domain-containing protein [Bacteroidota bacterium]